MKLTKRKLVLLEKNLLEDNKSAIDDKEIEVDTDVKINNEPEKKETPSHLNEDEKKVIDGSLQYLQV